MHDVITIGRIGVDLYPQQSGVPLAEVTSFHRFLGGSPTNVAVGAARYGHRSAVVTKVGVDPFGDYAVSALASFGVDTTWVTRHPGLRTPLAFAELFPPDRFPLTFYREPSAPDMQLELEDLDLTAIAEARLLWVSGGTFSAEPVRSAVVAAVAARAGGETILDLDYRPSMWASPQAVAETLAPVLTSVSVVIGNEEEFRVSTGIPDPVLAARSVLEGGARLAILKRGPQGVDVFSARGETWSALGIPVDVVCGLGAGDAFGAAICHGILEAWPVERMLAFANAAGALITTRLACADAMPTEPEVEGLLAANSPRTT